MAEDRDQLVDEQAMDRMPVAPPEPGKERPTQQPMRSETAAQAAETGSGVDDEDPLSAHPT